MRIMKECKINIINVFIFWENHYKNSDQPEALISTEKKSAAEKS